ncbi:stage II sporulation protein P [Filobacillus milosensis]|uniref:Stage II sporulation protein P n=1 Tax=Filobacillus milosensis TaxID=94137 RepID=A0A4Y8ISI3_9BACI|nr:stage II sporulation protein P [Filobacillus milosensis]TFB24860.1 stage II sporulation protein P [Filobacillus milosensis]
MIKNITQYLRRLRKFKKHPFLLFQVLFICLILFIPIFSIKPFQEASTKILEDWVRQIDGASYSFFMSIDQPILEGLNKQHDDQISLASFALPIFTNLPYQDIRLLFGHELPRFPNTNSTIAIAGEGTNMFSTVIETEPPEYLFEKNKTEPPEEQPKPKVEDETILIYTTHNRESFLPHLPEDTPANIAYDDTQNVMKLSERLGEQLENYGLQPYVDKTDYWRQLPPNGYGLSYDYSRTVVKDVLSNNDQMKYLFDIHRDAMPRSKTTTKINGQSVARLAFVIGGENESYQQNLKFASELHNLLEQSYPGLSRGVIINEGPRTNGVYNQDLSNHSVIIEVGGIENSFDELNFAIDALSEAFSDYYFAKEGASSQ